MKSIMDRFRAWRDPDPCREILRQLQAYLDGEIDAEQAWQVASHLASCDGCSTEAEYLRAIKVAVSRLRLGCDPESLQRLRLVAESIAGPAS